MCGCWEEFNEPRFYQNETSSVLTLPSDTYHVATKNSSFPNQESDDNNPFVVRGCEDMSIRYWSPRGVGREEWRRLHRGSVKSNVGDASHTTTTSMTIVVDAVISLLRPAASQRNLRPHHHHYYYMARQVASHSCTLSRLTRHVFHDFAILVPLDMGDLEQIMGHGSHGAS